MAVNSEADVSAWTRELYRRRAECPSQFLMLRGSPGTLTLPPWNSAAQDDRAIRQTLGLPAITDETLPPSDHGRYTGLDRGEATRQGDA